MAAEATTIGKELEVRRKRREALAAELATLDAEMPLMEEAEAVAGKLRALCAASPGIAALVMAEVRPPADARRGKG